MPIAKTSDLKLGPIRGPLSARQVIRVTLVHSALAEVAPTPLVEMLENFSRDQHPDREIEIWESITAAYTTFISRRRTTAEEREEAFKLLLTRSWSPAEVVLQQPLTALTQDEAREILSRFDGPPVPLTVKV